MTDTALNFASLLQCISIKAISANLTMDSLIKCSQDV